MTQSHVLIPDKGSPEKDRGIFFAGLIALGLFPLFWGLFSKYLPHMYAFFVDGQQQYWLWFVGYLTLAQWMMFGLLRYSLRRAGDSLTSLGFPTHWPWWHVALIMLMALLLLAGAVVATSGETGSLTAGPVILPVSLMERVIWLLIAAPTAAIVEETIFRGFALTYLPRLLGGRVWLAVISQGLLFGLMHGDWQAPWPGGAINFASRLIFAFVFAGLFLRRRSLKLPIALHWFINAVSVVR